MPNSRPLGFALPFFANLQSANIPAAMKSATNNVISPTNCTIFQPPPARVTRFVLATV
jgi:hypothetical protein